MPAAPESTRIPPPDGAAISDFKTRHDSGESEVSCCGPVATFATKASGALWVNRSSHFAKKSAEQVSAVGSLKAIRTTEIDCAKFLICKPWIHGEKCVSRLAQPEIMKVSKQVREDTLSIFYGSHTFLVTLMDKNIDGRTIRQWLETIGRKNASRLRDVKLVYRTKKDRRYIEGRLLPAMRRLSVRTDEGMVDVKRLTYPFCYCEGCIRRLLEKS